MEPTGSSSELVKCANMLLSSLEPSYMWSYLGQLLSAAAKSNAQPTSYLDDNDNPVKRVSSKLPPSITEVCVLGILDLYSLVFIAFDLIISLELT